MLINLKTLFLEIRKLIESIQSVDIIVEKHQYRLTLFIFRRDLRLEDNISLIFALQNSEQVIPCFIFDPRQCVKNSYKSAYSIQFMIESLEDLQQQLKTRDAQLFLFYGIAEKIIEKLLLDKKIDAVYFNRDYTPFSQKRDHAIQTICKKHSVKIHIFDDLLLNAPEMLLKPDGTSYQIFSRFYQNAKIIPILKPQKNTYRNYYVGEFSFGEEKEIFQKILPKRKSDLAAKGGRIECLKKLKGLKKIKNYIDERDYPSTKVTTGLSPYLKFTTCSIREVYYAIKTQVPNPENLLRQLYWRDFFTIIAFYFPHVFGKAYHQKYDHLFWENDKALFTAWCEGKTGFPIVDAGMRQLNQTGYMHNRVRLITASFLAKDLHIDWRWGEKYFAQNLIDYDPAVNNGNWQWVAGTGTDAQPYFRIFNPWLQQRKFDPDCAYIKEWLPELKDLDKKIIHQWYKKTYHSSVLLYPVPIVDHTVEANKAKKFYGRCK